MKLRRVLLAGAFLGAILAIGATYVRYVREADGLLDSADLGRRASLSNPDWSNYEEDIKAQLGAGAVAEWRGRPVAVQREGARVRVTFRLEGSWTNRDFVLPVLMRDPYGKERRQQGHEIGDATVDYIFRLDENDAEAPLPWIVVKYPHNEDRLPLDAEGRWRAD